jgi:hypothetical protein
MITQTFVRTGAEMNTTRVTNPETIRKEFEDISIVEVKQAFAAFTAHLQAYHKDNFEMVTLQNGTLRNDQGDEILNVYLHDIDHNGTDEMVIITSDDKIQSEVESIIPLWHNLVMKF